MKKHWYFVEDGEVKEATLDNTYTSDPSFWYHTWEGEGNDWEDYGGFNQDDLYETYAEASNAAIDYCNNIILKYTNKRDTIVAKRITNEGS
jgi:hypothetical protein